MESILTSVKNSIGILEEYTQFDMILIMHINSVFSDLAQIGIGPEEGFRIEDDSMIWSDFTDDNLLLNSVMSYMYLRVKILFDPASLGSATLAAYERQIAQWEWRLNVAAESNK